MRRFEKKPRHLRFARWQHVMEQRLLACKTTRGTWCLSALNSSVCVYIYLFYILLGNNIDSRCASLGLAYGIFWRSRVPETSIIWGIESLLTLSDRRKDQMDRITSPCAMLLPSWGADLVPVVVIFNVMQAVKRVMNGSR